MHTFGLLVTAFVLYTFQQSSTVQGLSFLIGDDKNPLRNGLTYTYGDFFAKFKSGFKVVDDEYASAVNGAEAIYSVIVYVYQGKHDKWFILTAHLNVTYYTLTDGGLKLGENPFLDWKLPECEDLFGEPKGKSILYYSTTMYVDVFKQEHGNVDMNDENIKSLKKQLDNNRSYEHGDFKNIFKNNESLRFEKANYTLTIHVASNKGVEQCSTINSSTQP